MPPPSNTSPSLFSFMIYSSGSSSVLSPSSVVFSVSASRTTFSASSAFLPLWSLCSGSSLFLPDKIILCHSIILFLLSASSFWTGKIAFALRKNHLLFTAKTASEGYFSIVSSWLSFFSLTLLHESGTFDPGRTFCIPSSESSMVLKYTAPTAVYSSLIFCCFLPDLALKL